jgi:hypothetical protein
MNRVEDQCAELGRAMGEKYEVIRRIGSGGMADVFLARHAAHGALFAIKVLAWHSRNRLVPRTDWSGIPDARRS